MGVQKVKLKKNEDGVIEDKNKLNASVPSKGCCNYGDP